MELKLLLGYPRARAGAGRQIVAKRREDKGQINNERTTDEQFEYKFINFVSTFRTRPN